MATSKKITVLVFAPGESPVTREIEKCLDAMQAVVGGYIECVRLAPGVDLWCNEDGKNIGLPWNHRPKAQPVSGDIIAGTFFLARNRGGGTTSLKPSDIEHYTKLFG